MVRSVTLGEEHLGAGFRAQTASAHSRLSAIVVIDAVKSSVAMRQNEIAALRAVESALDTFTAKVEAHQGRVVNYTGDGALAVFESVVTAVGQRLDFNKHRTLIRILRTSSAFALAFISARSSKSAAALTAIA